MNSNPKSFVVRTFMPNGVVQKSPRGVVIPDSLDQAAPRKDGPGRHNLRGKMAVGYRWQMQKEGHLFVVLGTPFELFRRCSARNRHNLLETARPHLLKTDSVAS